MSLGERFRAAREERGLTLSEVAEQLRIRSVYLAAIEDENWGAIGASVYARGFLRTYARYLALDPEQAVAEYNATMPNPTPGTGAGSSMASERREPRSLGTLVWVAGAIALALIGFVVYLYVSPPRNAQLAQSSGPGASSAPAATATATASARPVATFRPRRQTLAIHLSAPSWLRVIVDGNVSIEGTFPAGTNKTFHGKTALVRVGNAGGVEIAIDGRTVGKLGGPGDVVEKSFVL